jgi:hypothetical protein
VDPVLRLIASAVLVLAPVALYSEAATAVEGFFPGADGVRLFYFFLDEPQAFIRAADEFFAGRFPEEAEVVLPR